MASTNLFDAQTTTGRIVPQVPEPVTNRLSIADIYDSKGKPRHELLREHMRREGRLELDAALSIIHKGNQSKETLKSGLEKTMRKNPGPKNAKFTSLIETLSRALF